MTTLQKSAKLGRVARTVSGSGFPHEFQGKQEGDYPFLKVSDLSDSRNVNGVSFAANWVSRADLAALGARVAPAGSIVFPKVGAALLKNVRRILRRDAAMDNNLMAVTPQVGDSRFWMYALSLIDLGEFAGSGPLPFVSDSQIRDLTIPFPGQDEQRRIADFLDAETDRIDRLVEAQERVSARLVERRIAGIFAAVVGAHHPDQRASSLAWSRTLPAHWSEVRVGLVARMGSGHTPSRSRPDWWVDCTIPWITTGEVSQVRDDRREEITETREKISELGLQNSSAELCPAGTVVLCRTASAGYSAVMGEGMATSQDFATWICGPRLNPYYLLWCLRAMREDLLGRLAMGSTHKTIYVPDLQMLRIPLPDLAEQHSIVKEIRDQNRGIDRLADAVQRQIALLVERRQALITAAVTGQLDVTTARPAHDREL
ncbi:type I restriction enzyme, S subunit [Streptomyces sp. TverLS-915]|uniref:restriction endonuclease subunit S n=1 Tax=Streptomyces sp. TverLS-915 TaxID=1839763 RepID=UPI00081DC15F|nr:restriction endonuclease subunit S [Streptomyces sp. TverLS-915]SCD27337.1 type I restriction enzyme, S subunit [Streptomyces sp. TverLS-915]